MLALAAVNTLGIVGVGYSVKAILYASAKTLGLIKNVYHDESCDRLNAFLIRTDLKQRIVKTHKLIMDIENIKLKDSVRLAIMDLNQTIYNINDILEDSLFMKNKHQELYFNRWRSLNFDEIIEKLTLQLEIFSIRYHDLINIITITQQLK